MTSAQYKTDDPKIPALPEWQQRRLAALQELFPEAFSEGKVDLEKLQAALGDDVETRPERYSFTWAGKRDAMLLLQTPSRATLIPDHAESVNFEDTGNIFIEGENLEVLKLLYKSYFGRVKMIYIDPPYNTGNDFIYPDNYTDPLDTYLKLTGQKDGNGNLLTSNPETSGRYHSAWLSMMYPRLFLARQLLSDEGVIFVSIDDHEAHNLRMLMNEVFGEEAFIADIVVVNNLKGRNDRRYIATAHERLVIYSREQFEEQGLELPEERLKEFDLVDDVGPHRLIGLRKRGGADTAVKRPNLFFPLYVDQSSGRVSLHKTSSSDFEVIPKKSDGTEGAWRWSKARITQHIASLIGTPVGSEGRYDVFEKDYLETDGEIRRLKPKSVMSGTNYSTDGATKAFRSLLPDAPFPNPKPVPFMKDLVGYAIGPHVDAIVLDIFAGSGTTAHAVLELNREDGGNRRFVMVQLPEPTGNPKFPTIADIGKKRIRQVTAKMQKDNQGKLLTERETPEDLGFRVFKLATSNYRSWSGVSESTPQAYGDQIALYADSLVEGWTEENVIYEVAIREGYGLNCTIETVQGIEGNIVYRVADPDKEQWFHICLDDALKLATMKALDLTADHLFICRDKALDDGAASNLALQCRLKTI